MKKAQDTRYEWANFLSVLLHTTKETHLCNAAQWAKNGEMIG